MALTKVQVISQALMRLGMKPVMNLNNQSDIVAAADAAFDFLLSAQMGTGTWRFATTIQQLSQLVDTPVGGYWQYAYQLPANYRKLIHLYPVNWDFEIYEDRLLYSNFDSATSPLYIEYQFVPVIENIPDYFWNYFQNELAYFLALCNAQSVQYAGAIKSDRDIQFAISQAVDAQSRPQTPLQSRPVIANRYVSTFASG